MVIFTLVPDMVLNQGMTQILIVLLTIYAVIAVLAFVLSLYASQTFTRPIRQISDAMTSFDGNDFTHTIQIHTDTELDKIGHAYNEMLKNIEEFQNEVKNQQKELRISEMNTLISQINPHFLYNTLDSIIWMIQSGEYKGAEQMVSSLAKFFRISLSQGKDIIPLEKELEHATSYLAIQNIRFKDKFEFSVQADKKLLHYLCPKLSIQPLLENAIYHGMEGVYDDGEITISVYEKDNLIHIDVSDNGLGMPEKVVEYIMHNRVVSSKRGSGIGVRNVDERIKLIYGEQYGVTIESELDEGTTATIIIPKLEETAEINSDESNKTKL